VKLPGYYEFYNPVNTIAGHAALERVPRLLASLGIRRPMIIADPDVVTAGLLDTVTRIITPDISVGVVFNDVPASTTGTVADVAGHYRQHGCDALVAVGGGSVIDTAKAANILVSENGDDLRPFQGRNRLTRRLKPLVVLPTTAGTGSEATMLAVVADPEHRRNISFTSNYLYPDAAILDPRLTMNLSAVNTAAAAMDALTHAVEAYTGLAKNPLSDAHARMAIELIGQNLMNVVREPQNTAGRLALAIGANLAGAAFSNAMAGMVHTLGNAVAAVCGVPHGTCMAILLPYGLEYNMHKNGHIVADLLLPLSDARTVARTPNHLRARQVVAVIRQFNETLHAETGGRHSRFFKEVTGPDGSPTVPLNALDGIAKAAMGDGSIMYNPEELDVDDLEMVLARAWSGDPLNPDHVNKGSLRIQ
jgi:alcohol dehydrogenase